MNKLVFILILFSTSLFSQVKIAQLKYDGGGDWYANPSALKNLIKFANDNISTRIISPYDIVDINSDAIYSYPFVHMTGHGNVIFTDIQIKRLRNYLDNGGFLHIDDNYGMHNFITREITRIYPERELKVLPYSHPIFHQTFSFENGLPKIHEHDNKTPQAFAITHNNRVVLLYTHESDISDGWEDAKVHNDPENLRLLALKMGCNIIEYSFTN
ncbi:MAG: DUF4159 domain-containing protein [Flavobacteriales bacterium]|nr:DUF4159 domain-containing protein [Flavobacteriales bacterium]